MLNPNPQQVRAPWFQSGGFFDPHDLIQTKYEMLRHVQVGGASKVEAANLFGMSRPTFYQAEAAFAHEGLAGLLPKQRGPRALLIDLGLIGARGSRPATGWPWRRRRCSWRPRARPRRSVRARSRRCRHRRREQRRRSSPLASAAFTYLATTPLEIDSARAMRSCESAQSYLSRNSSLILCMAICSAGIPFSAQSARG